MWFREMTYDLLQVKESKAYSSDVRNKNFKKMVLMMNGNQETSSTHRLSLSRNQEHCLWCSFRAEDLNRNCYY